MMAKNISINIEDGYLHIKGHIPVVDADEELESFVRELKFQLFGKSLEEKSSPVLAARSLNEKDAAKYIGMSVSFLRERRYKGKDKKSGRGPKYMRDSKHRIRYLVKELDEWLEQRMQYSSCCEEEILRDIEDDGETAQDE
ncbi:MAG: helix-turn-helix domain-containing protein [Synergistaceae bacterium]|jgi:hypothetical protein|nr:helix-turn-helix domain-containing protein [Synergistaceae bacterium]